MKNNFKTEYKLELYKLRNEAKKFSQNYPEIAPFLEEKSNDPDTERLLEGAAYLNALIQQRLNDEFPELVHELIQILFPYYLKPTPSICIIEFTPEDNIMQAVKVNKFTDVKSKPYNGIKCQFHTVWDIDILPINLKEVKYEKTGLDSSELNLNLEKNSNKQFYNLNENELSFYINETIFNATALSSLLTHFLGKIEVYSSGKKIADINVDRLENLGFNKNYELLYNSPNALNNYRLLQEYFVFFEKFMFFKLKLDFKQDLIKSNEITIKFKFNKFLNDIHQITENSIKLHCVPVINIFKDHCEPIKLKGDINRFEITPSWENRKDFRIYEILEVTSTIQGKYDIYEYNAFNRFLSKVNLNNAYSIIRNRTQDEERIEKCYIELYRKQKMDFSEVLSIVINASNGKIPEKLGIGDVCFPTISTPARVSFRNITIPTSLIETPIDDENLWLLISHATTNILTITSLEKFKEIMSFYLLKENKDKARVESNRKKINSIEKFNIEQANKLYKGQLLKGVRILLELSSSSFNSLGDMYLFLDVIHHFFVSFASINHFVELEAFDNFTGESFICKEKIGKKISF